MGKALRVLLVEDSTDDALMVLREIRRGGYDVIHEQVQTPGEFQAALNLRSWDIIVSDWHLPHFNAPAALGLLKKSGLDLPFVILSGVVTEADAVEAMKAGAHDFMQKSNLARLIPAMERELREADLRRKNKRLEEALQQAQKIEIIGRFAGEVADEFKEALVRITEAAAELAEQLPRSHPAYREVQEIQAATERAGLLTLQLLSLGQNRPPRPAPVELNSVITDNYELLRHIIGSDVRLATTFEPALGLIRSDRSQIEQLVLNLAVNARDATPAGGRVSIETANVELDESYVPGYLEVRPGRYTAVSVRDTGCGISPEIRPRIFEPFFSTKKGRGAGMGLAFVYSIVKQNGGDIRLETEPGRGTSFTIYLPQMEADARRPPGKASPPPSERSVLLVEDDPEVRAALQAALAEAGYAVLHACDGRTARLIARSARGPIALLLTPVVLPDMTADELSAELLPLHPEMQVVYSCSCDDPRDVLVGRGQTVVDRHGPTARLIQQLNQILEPSLPNPN